MAVFVVPKDVAQERFDNCKQCDRFFAPTSSCKECGCFMKIKVKVSNSYCPINKWSRYWVQIDQGS